MHADMIYQYPIWAVGLLVVGLPVAGAVLVEFLARRVLPLDVRRQGNDVAASMFSVVGVTFAVLLAFVVMLTYEGYASARATTVAEAMAAREVADAASGLAPPARAALDGALIAYLRDVVEREWPAQARGREDGAAEVPLRGMVALAVSYRPAGTAETDDHAALLASLSRLRDARGMRRLAAASAVPALVWMVVLVGGALTVVAASFLAAPSARMHMAMSATLAASGGVVLLMVIALSQPFRGDIRISPLPFEQVEATVAAEAGPTTPAR